MDGTDGQAVALVGLAGPMVIALLFILACVWLDYAATREPGVNKLDQDPDVKVALSKDDDVARALAEDPWRYL